MVKEVRKYIVKIEKGYVIFQRHNKNRTLVSPYYTGGLPGPVFRTVEEAERALARDLKSGMTHQLLDYHYVIEKFYNKEIIEYNVETVL